MEKEFINTKQENLEDIAKTVYEGIQKFFSENDRACIVFLNGDLGAGKTTFTKYLGKVFGEKDDIISPTFVLRKDYESLIHIDGYRFEKIEESKALELERELLEKGKVILIEWPERFVDFYNLKPDIDIYFKHKSEYERDVFINIL